MRLYIGNKNYSSWSLRPWLLLQQAGIPFEEVKLRFDDMRADGPFKREALRLSPTGRVPVLEDDGLRIWDSLAIAEYLAERFTDKQLWPADGCSRARARCVTAEMHGGFGALRTAFPMNIELNAPEIGPRVLAEKPAVAADLARIDQLFESALTDSGGPWLFGSFSIADAYFAPIASRIRSYGLPLSAASTHFVDNIFAQASMQAWIKEALTEHDFIPDDEPYRTKPV
jgi:glutathione S-transferase